MGLVKMEKTERVIKALGICKRSGTSCGDCPYRITEDDRTECIDQLMEDAEEIIKELKENEPETTAEIEGGGETYFFVCGECRSELANRAKYCSHCGRKVDWAG